MNNFQGIGSGKAELQDTYPSAAYDALNRRKASLRRSIEEKAQMSKDVTIQPTMAKIERGLKPRKAF